MCKGKDTKTKERSTLERKRTTPPLNLTSLQQKASDATTPIEDHWTHNILRTNIKLAKKKHILESKAYPNSQTMRLRLIYKLNSLL